MKKIKRRPPTKSPKKSLGGFQNPAKALAAFVIGGAFLSGGLFVLAAPAKPDLSVNSLTAEAQMNDTILVSAEVVNEGTVTAPASVLEFEAKTVKGGTLTGSVVIPSLNPGASQILTTSYAPEDAVSQITALANPDRTFSEKSFGNNKKKIKVPLPDLAILSTLVEMTAAGNYLLTVEVSNEGNAASPAATLEAKLIKADGSSTVQNLPIGELGVGESESVSLTILAADNIATVNVFANKAHDFKEITYGNNHANGVLITAELALPNLAVQFGSISSLSDKEIRVSASIVAEDVKVAKRSVVRIYAHRTFPNGNVTVSTVEVDIPALDVGQVYPFTAKLPIPLSQLTNLVIIPDDMNVVNESNEDDSYVSNPNSLSDLIITDAGFSEGSLIFKAVLKNIGGTLSPATSLNVTFSGGVTQAVSVPSLIAGAVTELNNEISEDVGTSLQNVVINVDADFDEITDLNNSFSLTFDPQELNLPDLLVSLAQANVVQNAANEQYVLVNLQVNNDGIGPSAPGTIRIARRTDDSSSCQGDCIKDLSMASIPAGGRFLTNAVFPAEFATDVFDIYVDVNDTSNESNEANNYTNVSSDIRVPQQVSLEAPAGFEYVEENVDPFCNPEMILLNIEGGVDELTNDAISILEGVVTTEYTNTSCSIDESSDSDVTITGYRNVVSASCLNPPCIETVTKEISSFSGGTKPYTTVLNGDPSAFTGFVLTFDAQDSISEASERDNSIYINTSGISVTDVSILNAEIIPKAGFGNQDFVRADVLWVCNGSNNGALIRVLDSQGGFVAETYQNPCEKVVGTQVKNLTAYMGIPAGSVTGPLTVVADPTNLLSEYVEGNNTKFISLIDNLPDLTITGVTSEYRADGKLLMHVTVKNAGNAAIIYDPSIALSFDAGSNHSARALGGDLAAGESRTLDLPLNWLASPILITVDKDNVLTESNENNNQWTYTVPPLVE